MTVAAEILDLLAAIWRRLCSLVPAIPPVPAQALAAFHVSVGFAILLGGPARLSGPGWAGARWLAPWWLWGIVLTAGGAFVLYAWPWLEQCHPRVAFGAIVAGSTPLLFLTIGFVYAAGASTAVALTGVAVYGSLVAGHLHLAVHIIRTGELDRKVHP